MKQFKMISLHLILLLILAGFVMLPPYLSNMQDQTKMNQISFEKMDVSSTLTRKQLSSAEKIRMIISFGKKSGSVMMTEQSKPENTSISVSQIESVCIEELKKLQKVGVYFTPASSEKAVHSSYSLQTFVDISKPSTYVIIWKVNMIYDDSTIELTMDDQTHTIFSFSILQNNIKFIDGSAFVQNWLEYLGLNKDLFSIDTSTKDYVLGKYRDEEQPFYLQYRSYRNKEKNYYINSINFSADMKQP